MKLGIFVNPDFNNAMARIFNESLPVKAAYKVGKIQKILADESARFNELRQELVKRFAVSDKDGNPITNEDGNITIADKDVKQFSSEMQDLINIEVDLPKIHIDDLGDGIKLSSTEILLLEHILDGLE